MRTEHRFNPEEIINRKRHPEEQFKIYNLLRGKLQRTQKRNQDLKNRLPKFSEKETVWVSATEQGIIKKVSGTWDDKLKRVVAEYHVMLFNGKKKSLVKLAENKISKDPEYFLNKSKMA